MKKLSDTLKSIFHFGKMGVPFLFLVSFTFIASASVPAFADNENNGVVNENGCVQTAILGEGGQFCSDDNQGGGVIKLILDILDIVTVGVGILGVIAISVVGIQYLTAGSSEEKVRTAKRRLFEIIIGLVAYAVLFALLKWLLPGFNGRNSYSGVAPTHVIASQYGDEI